MYEILTTYELIQRCKAFKWTRDISVFHVHHTWRPSHKDYNGTNGLKLQQSMADYHVNVNKWSDIGQHLTLLPDGKWVTGRNWNIDPASVTNANKGAFAVEMVGNFDKGFDTFGGAQAEAMFTFLAWFVQYKILSVASDVKFHRDYPQAGKTCPGTGIDKAWFVAQLMGRLIRPATIEAILELHAKGIINTPDYWLINAGPGKQCKGDYVGELLTNLANKI